MKKVIILTALIIIIMVGTYSHLNSPPPGLKRMRFQVKYGETVRETAQRLENSNVIRNADFFIILSYLHIRRYIKAGTYEFFSGMTSLDILIKLTRGEILTVRVTIPEGFNIYQTARLLDDVNITEEGNFLYYANNEEYLDSIGIRAPSAEGYLFPDTYVFPAESDARDIILLMNNKMDMVLDYLYATSEMPAMGTHEILTLASLIEKEAKYPGERPIISSVFHNRLKKNMRLDCDPTVRYAVKKFSGRLTYDDLAVDSPYNTYKTKGLPPTPICCPGRHALETAIEPASTNYLFFVARNDGSHYFSTTLRTHNRAVDYYQKGIANGFKDTQKRYY